MHMVEETVSVFGIREQVLARQVLFEKGMDSTVRVPCIARAQSGL
jgi:hypothetical protein